MNWINVLTNLISNQPHLPEEVLTPVCCALENEQYPVALIDAVIITFNNALASEHKREIAPQLLRALAANSQHIHVKQAIKELLSQEEIATEILITLSGRCWQTFSDVQTLASFFEHLLNDDLTLFASIFKDLVAIPAVRPIAFQCIRAQDRSTALAQAIGKLFSQP